MADPASGTLTSLGGYNFFDEAYAVDKSFTTTQQQGAFPTGPIVGDSGNTYAFAPATGDDALVLKGTLTLTPTTASTLYVLGTSVNGLTTDSYTVSFVGGTTITGSFTLPDWFSGGTDYNSNGTQTEYSSLARILTSSGAYVNSGANLYSAAISIPAADQALDITSLSITAVTSGTVSTIFAVSGVAVPEPTTCTLMLGVIATVSLARRRRNRLVTT